MKEDAYQEVYSNDDLFNITSWGADLSFRELNIMYEEGDLLKPELQRNYVWTKWEASRFIESILLGLPIPSIFLADTKDNKKLIIDGYQRIMTMYDYMYRGFFANENKVFKLSNTDRINARWRNKAFKELSLDDQRKLKLATIHAIIFVQKSPANDDTSMFQIFERINTSGRSLNAQEVRNCVCQGRFNSLLFKLNQYENWRKLYGKELPDERMRDMELILRFFAMREMEWQTIEQRQINLKQYLDSFMKKNSDNIDHFEACFIQTIDFLFDIFDDTAFKNIDKNGSFVKTCNPTIFEAIMIAADDFLKSNKKRLDKKEYIQRRQQLLLDEGFSQSASIRTTNVENILRRINRAKSIIFGL